MILYRLEDFSLVRELPHRVVAAQSDRYFFKHSGKVYHSLGELADSQNLMDSLAAVVQVCVRVRGGKGGFGSRLKAEGQRLSHPKRSGNMSACRDLQGRRLQDVRDAQAIHEYLQREPELKAKAHAERLAYYQRVLSPAVQKPKHTKKEEAFVKSRERTLHNIEAAVTDSDFAHLKKK